MVLLLVKVRIKTIMVIIDKLDRDYILITYNSNIIISTNNKRSGINNGESKSSCDKICKGINDSGNYNIRGNHIRYIIPNCTNRNNIVIEVLVGIVIFVVILFVVIILEVFIVMKIFVLILLMMKLVVVILLVLLKVSNIRKY